METSVNNRIHGTDSVKGLLILFIIIGHNTAISQTIPHVHHVLYYFHVSVFFLLPFVYTPRPLTRQMLIDRSVRYLVPHVFFFSLAAILVLPVYHPELREWLRKYFIGLATCSARTAKEATGFQLYFFLPTLLLLNIFYAFYNTVSRRLRILLVLLTIVLHGFIGVLPVIWKKYLPFGLPIVLFIFPIGLLVAYLWKIIKNWQSCFIARSSFFLALILIVFCRSRETTFNLGTLYIYGWQDWLWLLIHDLLPIVCMIALLLNADLISKIPYIDRIGKQSLVIFLVHSMFFQLYLRIAHYFGLYIEESKPDYWLIIVTLLPTVVTSYIVAWLISRSSLLANLMTPRSAAKWAVLNWREKNRTIIRE